jgi:uncharacterized membrane protein YedE/YeeE
MKKSNSFINISYLILGVLFGVILIKSEVVSWFRIQEMFRFQSFHMYGIIGSAILVGFTSIQLMKKFDVKTLQGEKIVFKAKPFTWKSNLFGGILFGLGWAIVGACPGPLYALIGNGNSIILVVLLSAIFGTLFYGIVKEKIPH